MYIQLIYPAIFPLARFFNRRTIFENKNIEQLSFQLPDSMSREIFFFFLLRGKLLGYVLIIVFTYIDGNIRFLRELEFSILEIDIGKWNF